MVKQQTSAQLESCSVKTAADSCILSTYQMVKVWSTSASVVGIETHGLLMHGIFVDGNKAEITHFTC